ncbi:efflux transporter periplasmic adaptor subunit [Pseudomonas aeruginosa]|uniref:efflux RND transporter periplasmic adaptor subunit n=1 Tax=Pseudomonas aeruginosa TaxID=287 RepID=UPI001000471C|nr:efflux RND transporter periplasmic adaptor subunit [Pseudomonas aeruginosa]MBG4604159.1 efflux RND transporter periplasmic adaptor subunit [Pseudomonas aeruginosa]MBH8257450.1 efflux RND transporter periplasmic adaptor subunit [Pseudomonas aeruginosa]MCV3907757.1 efflux RND transporter periplasmic adaptor subunit [Pseudomonas aeruginosa]NPS39665.1 efflux RND transporter periplasmic adaptor subunit [Pseudomonas aeruginosa]NPS89137.1 efflux RND transporter periplasmic adaptor subunit [Pseudom
MKFRTMQNLGALLSVTLLLSACKKAEQEVTSAPPEVGVVELKAQDVLLTSDLPGRTTAYRAAEVRPQVSGIIQKRLFTEGAVVRKGQQLYQIDPALYQAAVDKSEATRDTARNLAQRYQRLLETKAISRQQFDDAQANWKQAEAELKTARINLEYTRVLAPIDGRISRSNVTEGALVSAQQSQELASINQLDPIYVDVTQASTDMLRLRRELDAGHLAMIGPDQVKVELTLEDGSPYAKPGALKFSEVTVDPTTGAVTLRAQFPNPDGILLPGMFVHGALVEGLRQQAILVPQQGVTRNLKGEATAWVVGEGDKAELRQIAISRTIGNQWLVESGLKAGERVVTEGVQRVQPGAVLKPVAAGNVATRQSIVTSK